MICLHRIQWFLVTVLVSFIPSARKELPRMPCGFSPSGNVGVRLQFLPDGIWP
jgi:hypothetical protein